MVRYLITFSYDGSGFDGYQKQPKHRTVQGELEKVLKKINNDKKVEVQASGRTDKGVHALNQKAHFELEVTITESKLKMALNSYLPNDIHIKTVEVVPDTFHARYNVKAKEYMYLINIGEYNPLERNYVFQYNKTLDIVAMERALKYLEGEHDFESFSPANNEKENFVRTISQTNLIRDLKNPNKITIIFLGTGFLRYMVRNMIGTLIEIGEGKRKAEDIIEIINAKDRKAAGPTSCPEGLYLRNVFY